MLGPRPPRSGRLSAPDEVPIEATPLAGLIAALALLCIFIGLVA
jgi:hypothetical protein